MKFLKFTINWAWPIFYFAMIYEITGVSWDYAIYGMALVSILMCGYLSGWINQISTRKPTTADKARRWYHRLVRHLLGVDEALEELRSINRRLKNLEGCVRPGVRHKPNTPSIVTSHWND